jgi:hypothetical protein
MEIVDYSTKSPAQIIHTIPDKLTLDLFKPQSFNKDLAVCPDPKKVAASCSNTNYCWGVLQNTDMYVIKVLLLLDALLCKISIEIVLLL